MADEFRRSLMSPEEKEEQAARQARMGPMYTRKKLGQEYNIITGELEEVRNELIGQRKQLFNQFLMQNYKPNIGQNPEEFKGFAQNLGSYLDQNTDKELKTQYELYKETLTNFEAGLDKGVEAGAGVSLETETLSPEETQAMTEGTLLKNKSEEAAINTLKSRGRISGLGAVLDEFTPKDQALIRDEMKTIEAEPESLMGKGMETVERLGGALRGGLSAVHQAAREIEFDPEKGALGHIGEAWYDTATKIPEGIARGWNDPLRNPLLREGEINRDLLRDQAEKEVTPEMREKFADLIDYRVQKGIIDPEDYEKELFKLVNDEVEKNIDRMALSTFDLFTAYPNFMGGASDVILDPTGVALKGAQALAKSTSRGVRAAKILSQEEKVAERAARAAADVEGIVGEARKYGTRKRAAVRAKKLGKEAGEPLLGKEARKKLKEVDKDIKFTPEEMIDAPPKPTEVSKKFKLGKGAALKPKRSARKAELEKLGKSKAEIKEILNKEFGADAGDTIRKWFASAPAKPVRTGTGELRTAEEIKEGVELTKFKKFIRTTEKLKESDKVADDLAKYYRAAQARAEAGSRKISANKKKFTNPDLEINVGAVEAKNLLRGLREAGTSKGMMVEMKMPTPIKGMTDQKYNKAIKETFAPEVQEIMAKKMTETGLEYVPLIMNDRLYVAERTLARHMESVGNSARLFGLSNTSDAVQSVARNYKKYIRPVMMAQKMLMTVGKPGFAFAESLSNAGFFAMGNRMQALNPKMHSMAIKAKFLRGFGGLSKRAAESRVMLKSGKKVSLKRLHDKFVSEGIGHHITAEFTAPAEEIVGKGFQTFGQKALKGAAKGVVDVALAPARASSKLVQFQDDYFKFQIWVNNLDDLSRGSLAKAGDAVAEAYPHYGGMSLVEREVLKDAAAFYGWKRWAAKNAYKQLRDNPRLYKAWHRAVHEYRDDERKMIPVRGKAIPWYNSGAAISRLKDQPKTVQEKVERWRKTGDPEALREIMETEFAVDKVETPFSAQMTVLGELVNMFKPETEADRTRIADLASPAVDAAFDILSGNKYGKAFKTPSINTLLDPKARNTWVKNANKSSTGRTMKPVIDYFNRWGNLMQYYAGDDKDATALAEIKEHYRLTAEFGLPILIFEALSGRSAPGSVAPGFRTKIVSPAKSVEYTRRSGVRELERVK